MSTDAEPPGLIHAAFFYRDLDEYLDTLVPFIAAGLEDGEPVLVAVPPENLTALRRALGDRAAMVTLTDMADAGRNPARTFGLLPDSDGPIRMVGEPVWPGRPADAYPACVENEALWNAAFRDRAMTTLCPYDAAGLSGSVLADARATHPLVWRDGEAVPNPDYDDAGALVRCNAALASDPAAACLELEEFADLSRARAFAMDRAESMGLPAARMADLELIVGELTTNSLKYSGGGCRLALWPEPGGLVCEVRDGGHFEDRLAGRRLPPPDSVGGRGLFLVNALADLVRTYRSPDGTTIQAHVNFDAQGGRW